MAYLPKAMVDRNVKTRVRKNAKTGKEHTDYEAYVGVDPFTGKAVRITRSSEADLSKAIADFYQRHKAGGDAAVRLTAMQALDAKNAYDALASASLNVTLYEAVSAYVRGMDATGGTVKDVRIKDAYEEFLNTKPEGVNKDKTIATTGRWVGGCGDRTLASVTAKDVEKYLEQNFKDRKPKTYNSHLEYIRAFLNWCCKESKQYLARNPARSLEFRPEPWEEPEFMKPADVERLFRLLESRKSDRPDMLAYAIVSFFCGCRAVEIVRMATDESAATLNIEDETFRITKGKNFQRGKKPRAFHIHPTALAWMKSFDFLSALKTIRKDKKRDTLQEMYDLARGKGIPVFHNCGRHTFITYHVAAYGEPYKTTAMVGTSEKMRADNYCGLASKADGEAYFRIMPSARNADSAA